MWKLRTRYNKFLDGMEAGRWKDGPHTTGWKCVTNQIDKKEDRGRWWSPDNHPAELLCRWVLRDEQEKKGKVRRGQPGRGKGQVMCVRSLKDRDQKKVCFLSGSAPWVGGSFRTTLPYEGRYTQE